MDYNSGSKHGICGMVIHPISNGTPYNQYINLIEMD